MSTHIISATQASRALSDILNKVHYQGENFEIKRGKEIIAKIIPASPTKKLMKIAELSQFLKRLPLLDPEDNHLFEKDLKGIRTHMKFEDDPWD